MLRTITVAGLGVPIFRVFTVVLICQNPPHLCLVEQKCPQKMGNIDNLVKFPIYLTNICCDPALEASYVYLLRQSMFLAKNSIKI